MGTDVADTPADGARQVPRASSQVVEMPDADDSTNVTPPPPEAFRPTRPSLKRRITRPSFMIELKTGSPVGEYEIEDQIGEGAMGTVYSAVHPLIGKQVAVKVLKPELCANQGSIDRFVQEAQAVNKIGHPNIVDVFSLGELPDGRAYFVMEWLRGEDLKTRLARGPMSVHDACDILDGIARALDAAHAKEIVHRDLKPDNVFLHQVESGPLMVKLLDFGIAKLVRHTPGAEKTQTGNMLGTPRYISPEQARGIQVDHRSDIYSLGVMAYEMLAGRPPFQGETAMDLVVKHLSDPPPPLGQFTKVPKSLEQCVMAMLDKDPAGRPSLQEVRAILIDPTRRMTPLPSRQMTSIGAVPHVRPTRRWPILVIGIVGALAIGIGTWKLVRGMQSPGDGEARVEAKASPRDEAAVAPAEPATAVETPTVETRGALDVKVTGAKDAAIFVDGEEWGRGASIRVELEPGTHELVVKPPGRDAVTQTVEIKAGSVSTVAIVVPPAPARTPARPPRRGGKPSGKQTPSGDDDLLAPKRRK
jgi:tRNA A-37 threonylcarbamoyl transferase component Bud32